jgi:hypothetical protein
LILITLLAVFPFLALLVMEQSRVIEAQRGLIRQLVGDSMELNTIKAHSTRSNAAPVSPAGPASPAPKSQAPAVKPQKPNHNAETPQPAPRPQPRRVIDMTHLKAA